MKQLEHFIISQGLRVPEPDQQHASTIDSLVAAYPLGPADDMSWTAANLVSSVADLVPTAHRPRVDEATTAPPQSQTHVSDHPSFFGDQVDNHAFGHTHNNEQMDLPTDFDLDWMLGLGNSDNPYGAFDIDMSGSTTFAGLASNGALFDDPILGGNGHHNEPVPDDDTSSDEEDHKEVTGLISNRIGTLLDAAKGNWRFYGATSNLPLSKDRQTLQLEPRSISQQQARISAQLEFLKLDHAFDAHLIQHLIRLYFTWQNPSLHIVDQHAFEQAQDLRFHNGEKSTFYTEFLVNAMLAFPVTFGPSSC